MYEHILFLHISWQVKMILPLEMFELSPEELLVEKCILWQILNP